MISSEKVAILQTLRTHIPT